MSPGSNGAVVTKTVDKTTSPTPSVSHLPSDPNTVPAGLGGSRMAVAWMERAPAEGVNLVRPPSLQGLATGMLKSAL